MYQVEEGLRTEGAQGDGGLCSLYRHGSMDMYYVNIHIYRHNTIEDTYMV